MPKQNVIRKNRIGMTLILLLYGVRVHAAIFRCEIIHKVAMLRKGRGCSVYDIMYIK